MAYADESNICLSAIHAGKIIGEEGGEFEFIIANGETEYSSSF